MPEIVIHITFEREMGKLELQSLAQSLMRTNKYMVENDSIAGGCGPKVTSEVTNG